MPLFSQLKYNNYVPQYVGAPLDEYLRASSAVQQRHDQVAEGYSLIGELADSLQHAPMDAGIKHDLVSRVNGSIEDAARQGNFDEMQNEMRYLAKQYSKHAAPIKENLSRYQAAEKEILDSKLPGHHQAYLLHNLRSKPGLSYDDNNIPQYLQADRFAENVDLKDVYEKFINDYKSDKAPLGIRAVTDPTTGVVEYYANGTNERVDANDVMTGLQQVAMNDPKTAAFISQDAAVNGKALNTPKDFADYSTPMMVPYANKAGFNKIDQDFKLGHADEARKDDTGGGYTWAVNWGIPAKEGRATPTDLRNTSRSLDTQKEANQDEWTRFTTKNQLKPKVVDGRTRMIAPDGTDYTDSYDLYNTQQDTIEAQKWDLQKTETDAKIDAGLPKDYTPNPAVLKEAETKAQGKALTMKNTLDRAGNRVYDDDAIQAEYQSTYTNAIDTSNDANLKAYRAALAKNAKDRTEAKGITTFGKNSRSELDIIGNRVLAGEEGFIKANDVATGRELGSIKEYGDQVQTVGWTTEDGKVMLIYRPGTTDKKGEFIPTDKLIKIAAPPELKQKLVAKKLIDPANLDIAAQIGPNGGKVHLGKFDAQVEIRRNAETDSTPVTVIIDTNHGPYRAAFPSRGDAIEFINRAAQKYNGSK